VLATRTSPPLNLALVAVGQTLRRRLPGDCFTARHVTCGPSTRRATVSCVTVAPQRWHLFVCRNILRKHRNALYAIRGFWKQLLHNKVAFSGLTSAFALIERKKSSADTAYKTLLERYPANIKVGKS
jgi:hypothetical protein